MLIEKRVFDLHKVAHYKESPFTDLIDAYYDDELAINASVTTSTTGTAMKRALDDANTADDQETKRLRSSN